MHDGDNTFADRDAFLGDVLDHHDDANDDDDEDFTAALQNYERIEKRSSSSSKKRKRGQQPQTPVLGRKRRPPVVHYPEKDWDELPREGTVRRGATKDIIKNRGLTKVRPKDKANPRIRHRKAYDKALQRRRSQVREYRGSNPAYGGEKTGIKTNLVKSVKLKQ